MQSITVGRIYIPMDEAKAWVSSYTDPKHQDSKKPYAYPAYDFLDTGSGASDLNEGDLLAPALLNATPSVSAFYRLRALAPELQAAMTPHKDRPLAQLSDDEIAERVRPVYQVLDQDRATRPRRGLSGTTLSKVLHRKRPESFCLHDRWIKLSYVGEDSPVPSAKKRSWADYMALLSQAMRDDLRGQEGQLKQLRDAVQGEHISDLRILDILAWSSRGGSALAAPK